MKFKVTMSDGHVAEFRNLLPAHRCAHSYVTQSRFGREVTGHMGRQSNVYTLRCDNRWATIEEVAAAA